MTQHVVRKVDRDCLYATQVTGDIVTIHPGYIVLPDGTFVERGGWKVQLEHNFHGRRAALPEEGTDVRAPRHPGKGCRFLLPGGQRCSKKPRAGTEACCVGHGEALEQNCECFHWKPTHCPWGPQDLNGAGFALAQGCSHRKIGLLTGRPMGDVLAEIDGGKGKRKRTLLLSAKLKAAPGSVTDAWEIEAHFHGNDAGNGEWLSRAEMDSHPNSVVRETPERLIHLVLCARALNRPNKSGSLDKPGSFARVRENADGTVEAGHLEQMSDEELLAVGIAVQEEEAEEEGMALAEEAGAGGVPSLVVMGGGGAEGEGEEGELPDFDELFLKMQQEEVQEEGKGEGMVSVKVEKKEEEKNTSGKEGVAMMEVEKGEEEEGEEKDGVLTNVKKEEEKEEEELDELFLKEFLGGKMVEMRGFEEMFWTAVGELLEAGKERGVVSAGLLVEGGDAAEDGEGEGKGNVSMEGMTVEEVCLKVVQLEEGAKSRVLEAIVAGLEEEGEKEGEGE